MLLSSRGDFAGAVVQFEAAVRSNPGYAEAQYNFGRLLATHGEYADAVPYLDAAVRIRPDYPEAEGDLGIALFSLGNYAAAAPHLDAAIRLQPGYQTLRFYRGVGLAKLPGGSPAEAAGLQDAVRRNPGDAAAHLGLGGLYWGLDRPAEAIAELQTAQRIRPDPAVAKLLDGLRARRK